MKKKLKGIQKCLDGSNATKTILQATLTGESIVVDKEEPKLTCDRKTQDTPEAPTYPAEEISAWVPHKPFGGKK